ncbi:EF-hand calcium-binding domain-containing protein 12 [Thomomys bottae]
MISTSVPDLGFFQGDPWEDNEAPVKSPRFNPERVIAHCFQQFKKDFHLPRCRRRIIILPPKRGQEPSSPPAPPRAPPRPIPTYNTFKPEDIEEQPLDREAWLSQRVKLRKQLESLGNVRKWLNNKADITPSESKVLQEIQEKRNARLMERLHAFKTAMKRPVRVVHHTVPQLQLPWPHSLSVVYSFLRSHKIKIVDLFENTEHRGQGQTISREEFITTLKVIGIPLKSQEVEDVVIYLSSLTKLNAITMETLNSTYKQWTLSQPKYFKSPVSITSSYKVSPKKPTKDLPPEPPKMNLLQVPKVDTGVEFRPLTLEEMEDVGKRYRERKRRHKFPIPSIQYSECCRLVRCGKKSFDQHCLPSTIPGDMKELINQARRDVFLTYLECCKVCEAYSLPLTEEILARALLFPGDKIVYQDEQVIPIRQPGGYYEDWLLHPLNQALLRARILCKPLAKKMDKKTLKKIKKMGFEEFENFTRKLKKELSAPHHTHPNFFWPGHLLDKLYLYLPIMADGGRLAIFSCVQDKKPAYSTTYHPNNWWPLGQRNYVTCANYDTAKVYFIN